MSWDEETPPREDDRQDAERTRDLEAVRAALREILLKAEDGRLPPRVALWAIAQRARQTLGGSA